MQTPLPPSPRPRGQIALIVCALLATFAYYFWSGRVFFDPPPTISGVQDDHFNLLARGFRKGHLYLDREVPPALITSKNPYDPKERIGITIPHDASYYKGRYYVYFGPAPAVTLFLPFSVLTGHDLPAAHGVLVYCFWDTWRWSRFFSSCSAATTPPPDSRRSPSACSCWVAGP